jgi:hypothetical protein
MYRIGIVPTNDIDRKDRIFLNKLNSTYNTFLLEIKKGTLNGFEFHTIDHYSNDFKSLDLVLFMGKDWLVSYKVMKLRIPSIYIAQESPIIEKYHSESNLLKLTTFFSKIMTWNKKLFDQPNFIAYYSTLSRDSFYKMPTEEDYLNRKLVTQVNSNITLKVQNELYTLRNYVNYECERLLGDNYTFYGKGWNKQLTSSYGGQIKNKIDTLNRHNFVFAIENCATENGYISEKILDAFVARTVPIYFGSSNISEIVPEDCYIHLNNFESVENLIKFIQDMTFEKYNEYLDKIESFFDDKNNPFLQEKLLNRLDSLIKSLIIEDTEYKISYKNLIFLFLRSRIVLLKRYTKCLLKCMGFQFECFKI